MTEILRFQIESETTGQRLDEFLAARVGQLSRLRIAGLLASGACTINRLTARAGQRVRTGEVVELALEENGPGAMTPEPLPLEINYEDDELLVVTKPAGMLVHPTRGTKSGTLSNALAYHLNRELLEENGAGLMTLKPHAPHLSPLPHLSSLPSLSQLPSTESEAQADNLRQRAVVRPGIVHRLDRATSGLMVVAKQQRALSILSRHFHHRLVEKRYLALLGGRINEDELIINAPIGRAADEQPHWRVWEEGKPAETRLRVLERRPRLTLAELEPVTGRTNQLRIHCTHLGHPIIGDQWYGPANGGARLCLHAARL
ncbi:MAG TPA: RluA family pseudouridine synthase, partial [Pyrinomonadaceae bacterium]